MPRFYPRRRTGVNVAPQSWSRAGGARYIEGTMLARVSADRILDTLRQPLLSWTVSTASCRPTPPSTARSAPGRSRSRDGASHDLQEPLRAIVGCLQLLEQRYRGRLDADADEFIGYAVEAGRRMQALVNDLLAFARLGTQRRPPAPVDTAAVLRAVLDGLRTVLAETGAVVTHDPLPVVAGDEAQLRTLFQNLIANAVKFRSDRPPRVHVAAERGPAGWTFAVRDNGIGIEPRHQERIFVMFQRLHARAEYPGTGIGLARCKKIVEQHGGRIWVTSEPGSGSTFHFTLPAAGSDEGEAA
jgi:light-regulated signal transduction histidine kinase (bacteriophytochrome)